jgi:aminopeptidase
VDGQLRSLSNIPSEEIYSTPDPVRTEGVARCTKPLALLSGVVAEDLELRFDAGRLVEINASSGQDAVRALFSTDDGAARLGEVALVDEGGRIGRTGRVYMETLLDENAASHVALGSGYHSQVGEEDRARVNESDIHVDVMIGSPEVGVTGLGADGGEVPVLSGGRFA